MLLYNFTLPAPLCALRFIARKGQAPQALSNLHTLLSGSRGGAGYPLGVRGAGCRRTLPPAAQATHSHSEVVSIERRSGA
jgi:hypothetical protein